MTEQDHILKANQFFQTGNFDQAEKEFLLALSQNPKSHRAHFGLGLVYLQEKKVDKAEQFFRKTVELQPEYAPAFTALGQLDELKNNLPAAILNYQKAVSLEEKNPAFANYVATARFRLSQIGSTAAIAQQIKEHNQKGDLLLKSKKADEALKEYLAVLSLAPDQLEALENGGAILFDLGKFEEAKSYFQKIIAIKPTVYLARLLLGLSEEALGHTGEAWEIFHDIVVIGERVSGLNEVRKARDKIEQMGPTKEAALRVDEKLKKAALLTEKENTLDDAGVEFREVLKIVPGNVRALYGLGVIQYKKDQLSEARNLFLEVIQKDPVLLRAHLFLGKIYLREKEVEKAFQEISRAKELGSLPVNAALYQEEIKDAVQMLSQLGPDPVQAIQIRRLLDQGEEFFKQENLEAAAEKFNQVLTLAPDQLEAMENLGMVSLRETTFDVKKARSFFEKMISINPDLLFPRLRLALLYQDQEEYDKAISEFQEVIKRDKKGTDISARAKKSLLQMGETAEKAKQLYAYVKTGKTFFKEEKWEEAKNNFLKALDFVPEQTEALYLLSLALIKQKNISEAEKRLETLVKIDPDHLEGHLQLGLLLGAEGKYSEAAQEMEKVISIGKEGKNVQIARKEMAEIKRKAEGEEHFKAGMEAMRKMDELDRENPPPAGGPPSEGHTLYLQKGIHELEQAVELNQDNPYYFYNLGFAYIQKRELVSAEALFKKAIEVKPDLLIAHYRLAVLYDLSGAYDASLKEYEKVIALGKPEDDEVKEAVSKIDFLRSKVESSEEAKGYSILGAIFLAKTEYDRARSLLIKATELIPENGDYWYNLGNYYEAVKDDDQAASAYQRAIEKSPNLSAPYFYLGIIQERKGEYQKAFENFQKSEKYLVDKKSQAALLLQARLAFYRKRMTGGIAVTPFGYDGNPGLVEANPSPEVYSTYGLNIKYSFYKSPKVILSAGLASTNSFYYYSQSQISIDNFTLDSQWPEIYGIIISFSPSLGVTYASGGMAGWNSQFSADFQRKTAWFDLLSTHFGYSYSVSVANSFYNSIQKNIGWSVLKNISEKYGSIGLNIGINDSDVAAGDDSLLSWNIGINYSHKLSDFSTGSFGTGYGQSHYKHLDSSALLGGLGEVYRKNHSLNFSASISYLLYRNISLAVSGGWQSVISNLPTTISRNPEDILSNQTSSNGKYSKTTLGLSVNYSF